MTVNHEELVKLALNGDAEALEKIIVSIKDNIYNLALRMLWSPFEAEDAAQEILIKVISNLAQFRNESKFTTWVYKIASNYLISAKKSMLEKQNLSFEAMEYGIAQEKLPVHTVDTAGVDRKILAEELKVSCTHAMLLCLNREDRIIYILSNMFNINSTEGAAILEMTPEAYRKRLSRGREKMRGFMEKNCGFVNPKACNCDKRIEIAIDAHRIDPRNLMFTEKEVSDTYVNHCISEMESFDSASAVFQSNPNYKAPGAMLEKIKSIVFSKNYKILEMGGVKR